MPFISIRIISSEAETLPIAFLSAGDDQNVLCASIVQLEGTVAAVPGTYTFEWEQILGTPVTLENDNTLSPWFINPNTGDLLFRLWVNRNTPEEMFSDVAVFRNPAATANNLIAYTPFHSLPVIISGITVSSETNFLLLARSEASPYSDQAGNLLEEAREPEEYAILWESPAPTDPFKTFLGVEVERWDSGWVVDLFRSPLKKHFNMVAGESYRLVTVWHNALTNSVSRETDNKIFVAGGARPGWPALGIATPLTNTVNLFAIKDLELYLEQRSLRTSESELHNNTISEVAGSFENTTVFRAAGVPIAPFTDNSTNMGIDEYLSSNPDDTTITRAGGISIG